MSAVDARWGCAKELNKHGSCWMIEVTKCENWGASWYHGTGNQGKVRLRISNRKVKEIRAQNVDKFILRGKFTIANDFVLADDWLQTKFWFIWTNSDVEMSQDEKRQPCMGAIYKFRNSNVPRGYIPCRRSSCGGWIYPRVFIEKQHLCSGVNCEWYSGEKWRKSWELKWKKLKWTIES